MASFNLMQNEEIEVNSVPIKDRKFLEILVLVIGGALLTLNAGFMNGIAFLLVSGEAVAHLSGTATRVGLSIDKLNFSQLQNDLILIFCFTIGATISGFVTPGSSFRMTRGYGPLFAIGCLLLVCACIIESYQPKSYAYFYLASMACGLQNALTTKYSGSIIRTTHVTGTFTDIGIIIGRMLRGKFEDAWKLKILFPLVFGFILGGVLSAIIFRRLGTYSLIFSAFLFALLGCLHFLYLAKLTHSFWRALLTSSEEIESTLGIWELSRSMSERVNSFGRSTRRMVSLITSRREARGYEPITPRDIENNSPDFFKFEQAPLQNHSPFTYQSLQQQPLD